MWAAWAVWAAPAGPSLEACGLQVPAQSPCFWLLWERGCKVPPLLGRGICICGIGAMACDLRKG